MVSPAKRRKIMLEQRATLQDHAATVRSRRQQAWEAVVAGAGARAQALTGGLHLEEASVGPPFFIHPSHELVVMCGGYTGCLACTAVSSCGGGRLRELCRLAGPAGSQGQVKRLCKGALPFVARKEWPSGETTPRPRLWRPACALP